MSLARSTTSRMPFASSRLVLATPERSPSTARTRSLASCSETFWWMRDPAKRVNAASRAMIEGLSLTTEVPHRRLQHGVRVGHGDAVEVYHRPTPTRTLRNLAGAAPCPTRWVCIGSPLPQFGTPQRCHSPALQIASQLPQNCGVIPV